MEASSEEEDLAPLREDRTSLFANLVQAKCRELQQIEEEKVRRTEEYIKNVTAIQEMFERRKKEKEEEDKAAAEQKLEELRKQKELADTIATLDLEKKNSEAAIARTDLNVMKVLHEEKETERQAAKKAMLDAYKEHRNKWEEDIAREKLLLEEFNQFNEEKKKQAVERMGHFISQQVVDAVSKLDRGVILTDEERQILSNATEQLREYEAVENAEYEISQAPTLVDDEIVSTRVKKQKAKKVVGQEDPLDALVRTAVESEAFGGPSKKVTFSQQLEETAESQPQQASYVPPKQAKAVESEKKKPPHDKSAKKPHLCGVEVENTSFEELPEVSRGVSPLPNRQRETTEAQAARESDSETDDLSPHTKKAFHAVAKLFKKEKIARPIKNTYEDIKTSIIGNVLRAAQKSGNIAKVTDVIHPKNKEMYVVKGGKINEVKKMDKYSWKHNGKSAVPGIGHRVYYQGRSDSDIKEMIPGLKKTIFELENKNTFIIHYKIENTEEPGVSGEEPTKDTLQEPQKSTRSDLRRLTLRKLLPKSWRSKNTTESHEEQSPIQFEHSASSPNLVEQASDAIQVRNDGADTEVGETDTENLITDYEVDQNTDAEGPIEESTNDQRVESKKIIRKLAKEENFREAVEFPWNNKWKKFSKKEAELILATNDLDNVNVVSETIIANPQGKQLYIFDVSGMENWKKHINKDTYRWKLYGNRDKADPNIKEFYGAVIDHNKKQNSGFNKRMILFEEEKLVMIGYLGDNAIAGRFPHGKSVINTRPFIPVSNALLEKKISALEGKTPKTVYQELINEPVDPNVALVTQPRNREHVKAVQEKLRRPYNFLKDDLTACYRVAETLPYYVRLANTKPDNANYVLCHPEILTEYRKALDLLPTDEPLIHHLDTTFEFNKKYLSVLSFRHPQLVDRATQRREPTVPLVSYIHQRKPKFEHDLAFWTARQVISDAVPGWSGRKKILVTDREFKSDDYMPGTDMAFCWNHLKKNLDFHARDKLKMSPEDASVAVSDLNGMLRSSCETNYIRRKREAFRNDSVWTPELKQYFDDYLDTDIRNRAGRWYLETINLPNAVQGITNNAAESLNNLYAKLRNDEPLKPLAKLIVDLHRMDQEFARSIQRAYFDAGDYHVKENYRAHCKPRNTMPQFLVKTSKEVIDEIAEQVRQDEEEDSAFELAARSDLDEMSQSESEAESVRSAVAGAKHVPEVATLAQDCVDNGRVARLDQPGKVVYGVLGADGKTAIVNLAEDLCSCNSRNPCYHWLATRVHVGVQNNYNVPSNYKLFPKGQLKKGRVRHHGSKRGLRIDLQNDALGSKVVKPFRQIRSKSKVHFNHKLRLPDITEEADVALADEVVLGTGGSNTEDIADVADLNNSFDHMSIASDCEPDINSSKKGLNISGSDDELPEHDAAEIDKILTQDPGIHLVDLSHLEMVDMPETITGVAVQTTGLQQKNKDKNLSIQYVGSPDVKITNLRTRKHQKKLQSVKKTKVKTDFEEEIAKDVLADTSGMELPSLESSAANAQEECLAVIGNTDASAARVVDDEEMEVNAGGERITENVEVHVASNEEKQEKATSVPKRTRKRALVTEEENLKEIEFRQVLLKSGIREDDIRLLHDTDCNIFMEIRNTCEPPQEAFITMRKGDKVITILPEDHKFGKREELYSAWSGAPTSILWKRKDTHDEKVTVIPFHTKGDLKEAAKEVRKLTKFPQKCQKGRKTTKLSDCYCAVPYDKNDPKIVCQKCQLSFHPECVGQASGALDWSCEKHMFLTGGAKWSSGKGTNNTCPVDNHLTLLGELSCRNSKFRELFNRENAADKAFYDCLDSASHGDYASAQEKWAAHIGRKDMTGTPGEMVAERLGESCQFVKHAICSYDKCPSQHQTIKQPKDMLFDFNISLETSFANLVTEETQEQCMKCHDIGIEDSKLKVGPLQPMDEQKPPAFLHITNWTNNTFSDICSKLPPTVKIGRHDYKKSMVVQFKEAMGGHFNAFINLDGQWMKYDGIDLTYKDEFINIARPRDFANDDWRTDSVVYTINLE